VARRVIPRGSSVTPPIKYLVRFASLRMRAKLAIRRKIFARVEMNIGENIKRT